MLKQRFTSSDSGISSEARLLSGQLIVQPLQSHQRRSSDPAADLASHGPLSSRGSGMCQMPQADLEAAMAGSVETVFGRDIPLTAISWFPDGPAIQFARLSGFDLSRFVATRRRALQRTFPGILVFGVVHVSLHVFSDGHTAWVPEVRLIMGMEDSRNLQDQFKLHCRTNGDVVQPLRTRALTDQNRRDHIEGVVASMPTLRTRTIDYTGQLSTILQPLTGEAAVEAALFLHRFPLRSRLILRCLRRMGGRNGFGLWRLD